MKHYGLLQWVDFVREVASDGERAAMSEHLEGGCSECSQAAVFCGGLVRVSETMSAQKAPDCVARRAIEVFPRRPQAAPRRVFRIPMALVYDSFLVPAPAGLRASWQVGWQAMYRAGDCSLDVRIEPDLRSSRAALIGQVSNHAAPESQMMDIPISLKSGRRVIAETRSNRFGEFQIEYDQQSGLELCVELEGGAKRMIAPLRKIAAHAAGGVGFLNPQTPRRRGKMEKN